MTTIKSDLVKTNGNAAILPATDAEKEFLKYQEQRDAFLETPFAHNTSLAKSGAKFTIIRFADRVVSRKIAQPDPENPGQTIEVDVDVPAYMYLATLLDEYPHVDAQTGATQVYEAGKMIVISLDQNGIRAADNKVVGDLVKNHGALTNMTLQEYPSRKKGYSNPIGIVHASKWRTLSQVAKERGLI